MKCKHCQTELEDGCKVCPECGKTVEQTEDAEYVLKVTPGKFALTIGACVVLMAALVALVIGGARKTPDDTLATTAPTTLPLMDTTEPATVPADTGEDNVTFKGTYLAADADVVAAADTVVARVGDKTLTNGELQVYYWMYVRQFLNSEMGYYAAYIGLDYTKPLDTQPCYYDASLTWHQYFLQEALSAWYSYQCMAIAAEDAGYVLDAELQAEVDKLPQELEAAAITQGYANVDAMLLAYVGPGADLSDYLSYENVYYVGNSYYHVASEALEPTDAEVEEYFNTYADEYAANGLTKDNKLVDVRHILILPEGATIETINSGTFSEEAWAAGYTQAENLLKQWNRKPTEENFAALANQHSADPGSNTNGGLYEDVYQGWANETFDAWCFDPVRKVGDTGIVQSVSGWHIMYYAGEQPLWPQYAKQDLITERQNAMLEALMEANPIDVDYAAIKIAGISLA